jgi:prevent-host-death family protein
MADCPTLGAAYTHDMSEMPIERAQEHLSEVVEEAERAGEVVYLTRHGRRVAAIVPPELAAEIEAEEETDAAVARAALEEGGEPIPWERVKAEFGL